jgi:hypothetical protein
MYSRMKINTLHPVSEYDSSGSLESLNRRQHA